MQDEEHVKQALEYRPIRVTPGDVLWTWCSQCMDRTLHLYDGHKLVCQECDKKGLVK